MKIIKRNGSEAIFDLSKIANAIEAANKEVPEDERLTARQIEYAALNVEDACKAAGHTVSVEEIQDMVEDEIMALDKFEVARKYIIYRYLQNLKRQSNTTDDKILSLIECNNEEVKQENSNKNPTVNSVQRDYMAGEISKDLTQRVLLPQEIVEAHRKAGTFGFEEVAFLLLMGFLPSQWELDRFNEIMNRARKLPPGFTEDMIMKNPSRNIMNKLARSVLSLYSYDDNPDDISLDNILLQSVRLVGAFPSIVANAYSVKRHYFGGGSLHIHFPVEGLSTAENFLRMIRPDKSYTEEEAHLLDMMLMVHAEHGGGNNSSFTTHVVSSSGTDTYSAISASLGSLKGPKHGGANLKVMEMFQDLKAHVTDWNNRDAIRSYLTGLLNREGFDHSGLIYGLGHAVYTVSDPRARILKRFAEMLSNEKQMHDEFQLYQTVEEIATELLLERRKTNKGVCANVDFYSGFVYEMLGIPMELYTPIFAIARIAGWSAHRIEELTNSNKIIRPAYRPVGLERTYVPLGER